MAAAGGLNKEGSRNTQFYNKASLKADYTIVHIGQELRRAQIVVWIYILYYLSIISFIIYLFLRQH